MKTLRKFLLVALPLSLLLTACQPPAPNDLEVIKSYPPGGKYFKSSMKSLHFIIEVNDIAKVDTTFNHYITAYQLPVSAMGIPDGLYTGSSPLDAFDYRHVVSIDVKDEIITSIDYNEVKDSGSGKQEDEAYCKEMKSAGTTPAIAYPLMEKQMLEKQDMMDVDAVSGATYSLYRMRYALTVALIKGKLAQ